MRRKQGDIRSPISARRSTASAHARGHQPSSDSAGWEYEKGAVFLGSSERSPLSGAVSGRCVSACLPQAVVTNTIDRSSRAQH
jgi:hypothetical protein